jgi:hypothetical protein
MHERSNESANDVIKIDGRELQLDASWQDKGRLSCILVALLDSARAVPSIAPLVALLCLAYLTDVRSFGFNGAALFVGATVVLGIAAIILSPQQGGASDEGKNKPNCLPEDTGNN